MAAQASRGADRARRAREDKTLAGCRKGPICPPQADWRACAALRRTGSVRLAPTPILRMGTRRAALHLDLFEQPGKKRVFQQPAEHAAGTPRVRPRAGRCERARSSDE